MNCPTCGTSMLPLFTGEFCPRECDLQIAKSEDEGDEYVYGYYFLKALKDAGGKLNVVPDNGLKRWGFLKCRDSISPDMKKFKFKKEDVVQESLGVIKVRAGARYSIVEE